MGKNTMNQATAQGMLLQLKRQAEKGKDIKTLHYLLPELGDEGIIAVYFRFWESMMISDVAKILGRSWDYTDQLIEGSIKDLRKGFAQIQKNNKQHNAA